MTTTTTDPRPDIPLGYTYDSDGRELTLKDHTGHWRERTRDPHGRVLMYKNSEGFNHVALALTNYYTLWFDVPTRTYRAGCRTFTRAEALAHWGAPRYDNRERAEIFTDAINAFEEPQ